MREVPESTMASQPWEQNATRPWILILQVKKKKSIFKQIVTVTL